MLNLERRSFLKIGGALALTGLLGRPALASTPDRRGITDPSIRFSGDGLSLTPSDYTRLLAQLAEGDSFERDGYGNGGIIGELEQKFAQLLGKETAVFLPTGTMSNHLAVRRLTGGRERVIVQADSHLYNDSGDCAQELSGLNLVPIAGEFGPAAIESVLDQTASGRVKTEVGAIVLESPLRRGFNTTHSLEQAAAIADLARDAGVGLHLDGARMFMQAAHQGHSPAQYAASFDTVYVSLYKNFNAAGGAVLAGPQKTLDGLLHERRMFGGSPYNVWPMAAVAMLFADGFTEEYRGAKAVVDQLMDNLEDDKRFLFEKIPDGSNSLWLKLDGVDPTAFIDRLATKDIHLRAPRPEWDGLLIMINPTISRGTAADLARAFRAAADG